MINAWLITVGFINVKLITEDNNRIISVYKTNKSAIAA